jgi:hypothetical protein
MPFQKKFGRYLYDAICAGNIQDLQIFTYYFKHFKNSVRIMYNQFIQGWRLETQAFIL